MDGLGLSVGLQCIGNNFVLPTGLSEVANFLTQSAESDLIGGRKDLPPLSDNAEQADAL